MRRLSFFLGLVSVLALAQEPSRLPRPSRRLPNPTLPKPTPPARSAFELALRPEWPVYLKALHYYRKDYPGVYPAPELVRWDHLPMKPLGQQVETVTKYWRALEIRPTSPDVQSDQLTLSRNANQALYELLREARKANPQASTQGSTRLFVDKVPADLRTALTPLDPSFQNTPFGKSLAPALGGGEIVSFSIDEGARRVVLETRGAAAARPSAAGGPESIVLVLPDTKASGEALLRTVAADGTPLGAGVKYRPSEFKGRLLNPRDTSNPYPLGALPKPSETWTDESGSTHFGGDGCKH